MIKSSWTFYVKDALACMDAPNESKIKNMKIVF